MTDYEQRADYRPGDPVPEDAVMVRAGPMNLRNLRVAVDKSWKLLDFYGLSMFSFPGFDIDQTADRTKKSLPQDEICETTAGEIWMAEFETDFELRRTGSKPGHFALIFADEPSDDDLRTVLRLFEGRCKENPHRESRHRRGR